MKKFCTEGDELKANTKAVFRKSSKRIREIHKR